jgi:hypothetical protein
MQAQRLWVSLRIDIIHYFQYTYTSVLFLKGEAMRVNSLLLACFLVFLLSAAGADTVLAAEKNTPDDLLMEAFKAEKIGGDSVKVMEKFEAVVKADPENYYALIKLGLMKMGDGKRTGATPSQDMDATEYFLRAALAKPSSPEAYLYLAQLNYRMGYVTEGDRYLKMSQTLNKHVVYDEVCMTGWRYEDTGNYYAAVLTYAAPALSQDSPFTGDPYLMKKLRVAALLSPPPYDWATLVTRLILGKDSKFVVEKLRNAVSEFLITQPAIARAYNPDFIVNMFLRKVILDALERQVKLSDQIPDRHELPTVMYKLFFCNPDEIPQRRYSDPYEAFVKASPGNPQDQQRVLAELQNVREKALAAVANTMSDEERARQLFIWLKRNFLQEYHALDGISAKGVVEDKKYLCLSGSILYTLLARDAKLDVKGFLMPGHAYAMFEGARPIRIETTTDGPEGFDLKPEASVKTREQDRALYQSAFESYGVVSDPMKFIAYQFSNTAIKNIDELVLNKYERLFRQVLKSELGLDDMSQTEAIEMWRRYGTLIVSTKRGRVSMSTGSVPFRRLVRVMASKDTRFRDDLIKQLDKNVEMIKTARGLSPFDFYFRNLIDSWTLEAARYEYLPAQAAVIDRTRKRLNAELRKAKLEETVPAGSLTGKTGTPESKTTASEGKVAASDDEKKVQDKAAIDAELEKIDQEEKQNWADERQYWLRGLKRLSAAVKQYPCNENLKESLEVVYRQARGLAERRQDLAALDELKTYAIGLLP